MQVYKQNRYETADDYLKQFTAEYLQFLDIKLKDVDLIKLTIPEFIRSIQREAKIRKIKRLKDDK